MVTPHPAPQIGLTTTRLPDVDGVLNGDGDGDGDGTPFPAALGRAPPRRRCRAARRAWRSTAPGFSRFVLLPLPRGVGASALNAAMRRRGGPRGAGRPGPGPARPAAVIRTPLLSVLMVTAGFHHATFLFAGAVTPGRAGERGQ